MHAHAEAERQRRVKARKLAHTLNRRKQRQRHPGRQAWRDAPATQDQIDALRTMAVETGRTFRADITRGQAWERIRETTTTVEDRDRLACAPPWYDAAEPSAA